MTHQYKSCQRQWKCGCSLTSCPGRNQTRVRMLCDKLCSYSMSGWLARHTYTHTHITMTLPCWTIKIERVKNRAKHFWTDILTLKQQGAATFATPLFTWISQWPNGIFQHTLAYSHSHQIWMKWRWDFQNSTTGYQMMSPEIEVW